MFAEVGSDPGLTKCRGSDSFKYFSFGKDDSWRWFINAVKTFHASICGVLGWEEERWGGGGHLWLGEPEEDCREALLDEEFICSPKSFSFTP